MEPTIEDKGKKSSSRRKVFKLKKRPAPNASEPSNGDSDRRGINDALPVDNETQVGTLAEMERKLRANIQLTLPSSAEARAELARSLPLQVPPSSSRAVIHVPDVTRGRSRKKLYGKQKQNGNTRWVVATEWPFSAKATEDIPFAKELWMMMTSFGDPRGEVVCRCEAQGEVRCGCLEAVAVLEPLVRSFATRLVTVCRQWSSGGRFRLRELRVALPGEMREYMAWKDAHSKRSSKNTEEKQARVSVGDEDVDDDHGGDDENDSADGEDEDTGGDDGELGGDDWQAEEEEVASRMLHRKRFADERTEDMDEDAYLKMFFEYRRAFFVATRGRKRAPQTGSRRFLANYIGLGAATEGKDRKLLEAIAFMMYDYVGRVVEAAIRRRRGGRLEAIPPDAKGSSMLTAEEIKAAATRLSPLASRDEKEHVRAMRAANPSGISQRPLYQHRVGLECRGNPFKWPCNTIEKGRVRVDGGQLVDTTDGKLAAEAMAILENDFADFDA